MKLTENQSAIVAAAQQNGGEITTAKLVEILGGSYFHNASHYIGQITSRMVKGGILERVKPGVFRVNAVRKPKANEVVTDENQQSLF